MDKLRPKKFLGQHFLTDKQLAQKIVRTLAAQDSDTVVEIGPGMGILTQYLCEKYSHFWAVEIDNEAIIYLNKQFPTLKILHEDVLKWNIVATLPKDSFLIGNLPYNISSPIFFHLLDHREYVKEGVFMIQKEVAERICAKEGNKEYGILSVLMGCFYELKYEFSVPPTVFSPPPKVMSAVFSMKRKEIENPISFTKLKHIVKTAFGQRRKTLRNALKGLEFRDFPEKEKWFTMRAEQLSINEFVILTSHWEK